jgi:DNA repair exonuclease SbcCD nuclease subunit
MFRFIHTADIHLDSPLKSLALRDPDVGDLVYAATRRTFERIIDLCLSEQVNALVIAGDLYDGEVRSMKTAAFLSVQMRRLENEMISVFMIQGNHDSESTIKMYSDLPSNVHVFHDHSHVKELRELGVAIHGVSFAEHHASESLLGKYEQPIAGLVNIGIMHTSLAGSDDHDVYAPCAVNDLVSHGFDYWALGHIHQRRIYNENPFVVMPGIPQGRSIRENGPKSVTIVEISDKSMRIEERFVADSEFQRVHVDLTDIAEWSNAIAELKRALEKARTITKARCAICRIVLLGRSSLCWRMRRDIESFNEEAKAVASQLDNVFVDGIDNKIEQSTTSTLEANPVNELETLMLDAAKDISFHKNAASFLEKAITALPPELRDSFGEDQGGMENILQDLLSEGTADVIATLKNNQVKLGAI